MLFDLQGRRKSVIKVIYLGLAILMGGGLVLFGIGGEVQGGFMDAFSGGGGDGQAKKDVEAASKRVVANPKDEKALEELINARFSYATTDYDEDAQKFGENGNEQLKFLINDWKKYVKLADEPDLTTAGAAVNAYIGIVPQDLVGATEAQTIVARLQPDAGNYLALMRIALSAGKSMIADASEAKALELATPDEKKDVEREIKQLRKLAAKRSEDVQKQINEQLAQQQTQPGSAGQTGSPFSGLTPSAPAGN